MGREHKYNKTQMYDVHSSGIFIRWLMCTLSIPDCNANSHRLVFGRKKSFHSSLCWTDLVELFCTVSVGFLAHLFGFTFVFVVRWVRSLICKLENFVLLNTSPEPVLTQPSQSSGPSITYHKALVLYLPWVWTLKKPTKTTTMCRTRGNHRKGSQPTWIKGKIRFSCCKGQIC